MTKSNIDVATDFWKYLTYLEDWTVNTLEDLSSAHAVSLLCRWRSDLMSVPVVKRVLEDTGQETRAIPKTQRLRALIRMKRRRKFSAPDFTKKSNVCRDRFIWKISTTFWSDHLFWRARMLLIWQFVEASQTYTRWYTLEVTLETCVLYSSWRNKRKPSVHITLKSLFRKSRSSDKTHSCKVLFLAARYYLCISIITNISIMIVLLLDILFSVKFT